jgi:hypothetical protein
MGVDTCRTAHVGQATYARHHVALHERVGRHAKTRMSHVATVPSDMQGSGCRTSRRSRATCKGSDIARRDDPERHAPVGMSLRTWVKYEIDRLAGSPDGSSQATFTVSHLAQRARVVRHAAAPWVTSMSANVALGSQAMGSHEKSGATVVPADSAALLTDRQMDLGLTVEELGELLDRNRRTIQRWQERGFVPAAGRGETVPLARQTLFAMRLQRCPAGAGARFSPRYSAGAVPQCTRVGA